MKTRIPLSRTAQMFVSLALLPILLGVLPAGGPLLGAPPAFAVDSGPTITDDVCMQTLFGFPVTNSNRLNCTANDIAIARTISVSPSTCNEGEVFDLTATFEVNVNASERYDAGFYFNVAGGANARLGTCSLSVLDPTVAPAENLDSDFCGDLRSAGTTNVTFTIPGVLCHDSNGDGFLNLPNCTSWHNNRGTACDEAREAIPETKSKCKCDDNFQVPVRVETAEVGVDKTASPTSVPETGGTVTYTVTVTNIAQFVTLTIDTLVDDLYGDLADAANTNVTDNTCPGLVGTVLQPGGSTNCSFKALVSGQSGDTVTDTVEVCGSDSANHDVCGNDDADVHITDVQTEPSLTKTAQSATFVVDVTYQVVVNNNSSIDTMTVNSLSDDKFGDIAQVQGDVISTNCDLVVGQTIAPSGNKTCQFVGRITTSPHTDTVTGGLTDDDGVNYTPSDDATVNVSISFP